jgi:hypothetical protein
MKKFKYEYNSIKLFPTKYKFYTKKQVKRYFDSLDKKNVSMLTYKQEAINLYDEKIHVNFSRKVVSKWSAIALASLSVVISFYIPLNIISFVLLGLSGIAMVSRWYNKLKFQENIMFRNFVDSVYTPEALEEIEKERKKTQ